MSIADSAILGATVTNWAHTHSASPQALFEPRSIEETAAVLALARARRVSVRVIGGLHSPNDCAMTPGCIISLRRLSAVRSVDAASGRCVVDAGALVRDVNAALDAHGLALPNLGSISDQTVAGSMATGTHGTGAAHGVLASAVVRVWLLTARGELLALDARERPALFRAALCSLGLLGVVVRVEIQAVPAFHLHVSAAPTTLAAVRGDLARRAESAQYYRFWWFPHTDRVWEWRANAVAPPPPAGSTRGGSGGLARRVRDALRGAAHWLVNDAFGFYALQGALWVAAVTRARWLVPHINALWGAVLFGRPQQSTVRSYDAFNFNCLFQQ
jgi:L-gulonolactone oxidase